MASERLARGSPPVFGNGTSRYNAIGKKGFVVRSHEAYKRFPKGYEPDHPRVEHLLRKGLTVGFPELPKGILASPKRVAWLIAQAKVPAPLVEWLTFATH